MSLNVDFARDLTGPENLESVAQLVDNAEFDEAVHGECIARELLEILQIHDGVVFLENIGETALRQTAMQRHLSAFESAHDAVAGNGPRAFAAAGRGFTPAGPHAAAAALFRVLLPGG